MRSAVFRRQAGASARLTHPKTQRHTQLASFREQHVQHGSVRVLTRMDSNNTMAYEETSFVLLHLIQPVTGYTGEELHVQC